jgi:integrase
LFQHSNGQWAKKVKGKLRYFGTDLDVALKRWATEKDHWLAGMVPPRVDHNPSLAELANLYLDHCKKEVLAGEVRADQPSRAKETIARLIGSVGQDARLHLITPQHWWKFREDLAIPVGRGLTRCDQRAASSIAADIKRIKAFINWSRRQKLLREDISPGDALNPPKKQRSRLAKSLKGNLCWTPEELREAVESADVHFKPVLLLAINCGMGVADIARLTRSGWRDRNGEFLHCPRHKTGVDRNVWLWPETIRAVEDARKSRPKEHRQKYESCLLLTKGGLPWWRIEDGTNRDLASSAMRAVKSTVGTTRTLYDCRRTFRTVASEVCDLEAINHCMGHDGGGEGGTYLQAISDERIKAVCQHVRTWMYGEVAE